MKRDIVIDADHILFMVTESQEYKAGLDGGRELDDVVVKLKPYKEHFKRIVADYVATAEVESIAHDWTIGKTRVILSDETNFRYALYPDYKKGRPPPPELRQRLKKWAVKKYTVFPNTEADDVVAYYVRKGGIGFTTDKDLFKGVAGLWFNTHYKHRTWSEPSKAEALWFFKCQCLAGDRVDGIPALAGIGLVKADQLLKKYGSTWNDILNIYLDNKKVLGKTPRKEAYTKEYMETMVRLVCMTQWAPLKGIELWKM